MLIRKSILKIPFVRQRHIFAGKGRIFMIYDVAVIGAGISGCMTAYRLSRYKLNVVVCEAGDDVASGCTRANSAIVHAGYDPIPGTLKAKLNVEGCAEMPEICEKLHVKYVPTGSLVAAYSDEEIKGLETLYQRGIANGVPGLEIIDQERLRRMEPNISDRAVAALWAPSAGIVCPYGLCIAVAEVANVNRTEFRFGYRVNEITKGEYFTVKSEKGDSLQARYVVNAAGCHSAEIAELAGEKDFPLEIIPRRGEYMLLDKSEGKTVNVPLFSVPTKEGKGILLTPTADGNLIVGPNAHVVPSAEETSTTVEGLSEIAAAGKTVKHLNLRAVITSFAGVRPTPRYKNISCEDFYIRPSEQIKGMLHLAGVESPGLASSPATGRYAVELLKGMGLELIEKDDFVDARPEHIVFSELSDDEKRELVARDPSYGRIICRCEGITEGEMIDAIRRPLGARSLDGVKRRTRGGMGRCQGGFCSPRVTALISRETGIPMDKITKNGGESYILTGER